MADAQNKGIVTKIHDATCLGSVMKIKLLQKVCPVCRGREASGGDLT